MVAQMILVHLVGVRIPAGERSTTKGFPLGKPFVVYFFLVFCKIFYHFGKNEGNIQKDS